MHDGGAPATPDGAPATPAGRARDPGARTRARPAPAGPPGPRAALGRRARALYEERRAREVAFGADAAIFGEPSWDILLDLYHWEATGRLISLSSSCIASGRPTTTAMRHVRGLERRGLVVRERDGADARRWWLRLTPRGDALMEAVLSARTY